MCFPVFISSCGIPKFFSGQRIGQAEQEIQGRQEQRKFLLFLFFRNFVKCSERSRVCWSIEETWLTMKHQQLVGIKHVSSPRLQCGRCGSCVDEKWSEDPHTKVSIPFVSHPPSFSCSMLLDEHHHQGVLILDALWFFICQLGQQDLILIGVQPKFSLFVHVTNEKFGVCLQLHWLTTS